MKLILRLRWCFALLFLSNLSSAQNWVLVKGDQRSSNRLSQYNHDKSDEIGCRYNGGVTVVDKNVYIFGGWGLEKNGNANVLNDFWKYSTEDKTWTLLNPDVNGKPIQSPTPRSNSLVLNDGKNIYILFGLGYDKKGRKEVKQDCWKFNIATQKFEEEIIKDKETSWPTPRYASLTWQSGDKLFLMGGVWVDSNGQETTMQDFWMYELSIKKWTKISESLNLNNDKFIYTDVKTADDSRIYEQPSFQKDAITWVNNGDLYYMASTENVAHPNNHQLWVFYTSTKRWDLIKVSKSNLNDQAQIVNPGFRKMSNVWVQQNKAYLYGGYSFDAKSNFGLMDDTWLLDLKTLEWQKTSGNKFNYAYAELDWKANEDAYKTPGTRIGECSFSVNGQYHFLIGGLMAENGKMKFRNDIWELKIPKTTISASPPILANTGVAGSPSTQRSTTESCPFTISPNPAQSFIQLTSSINLSDLEVRIYSDKNVLVSSTQLSEIKAGQVTTIDVSTLSSGIYTVEFKHKQNRLCTERLLIKQIAN